MDFNEIIGAVSDAGSVEIIDGLDFTFVVPIDKIKGYAVHSLKISPRIYPVLLAMQAGEPVTPGSYNCVFLGDFLDMSYKANLSLMGGSSVQLTVPIDNDVKTALTVELNLNSITGQMQISKEKYNAEAVFASSNKFSKASITGDFSYKLTNNTTIGGLMMKNIFEPGFVVRAGYVRENGKFTSGLIASYDGQLRFNKSLTYKPNQRVTGSIQLDFIASECVAQAAIGIERNFLMTTIGANATTAGRISSRFRIK